jgi:N utilization substance protein A
MTPEQLEAIEGIGPKTVEKISLAVNNYFASLEQGAEEAVAVEGAEGEAVAEEGSAEPGEPVEASSEEAASEGVTNENERQPEEGSAHETTE